MKNKTTTLLTLIVGVLFLRAATRAQDTHQSDLSFLDDQPITSQGGRRQRDAPEVVLQLKYDGGELNRIYLAQFRSNSKEWNPSIGARTNLCSDLCYAGLGGETCGKSCLELIPVGLKTVLNEPTNDTELRGEPRTTVCPTLCANNLGDPLCNCGLQDTVVGQVDWTAICQAFCEADRFVLGGCPVCDAAGALASPAVAVSRVLSTSEGWAAWCTVQCRQGQGGAACNCDRSPFQ